MALTSAVVGGGVVSDAHLSGLAKLPETELVAVCDVDEERATERAREYDLAAYTDLEAMLVCEDLDWLHVCTPVQTHLELAKTAIEAGVAVQIEKPVTETVEEVEELARAAERHDVPVSVVHNHNFGPAMRRATEAIRSGEIGDVRSVELVYTGETWPDDVKRGAWAFDLGGGEFEEGLPHPIYMLLHLGGYPRSIEAITADANCHRSYEQGFDYDGVQFQYESVDGVLCSGTVLAGSTPHKLLHVHGTDATLTVDLVSQAVTRLDRDYQASPIARALNNVDHVRARVRETLRNARAVLRRARSDDWAPERDLNPHYYQFEVEARALLNDESMPSPLEEARWTVAVMDAIRAVAAEDEPVEPVAEPPSDHA